MNTYFHSTAAPDTLLPQALQHLHTVHWMTLPDGGILCVGEARNSGALGALASLAGTTVLPHPHSPKKMGEHAVKFAHYNINANHTMYDVLSALALPNTPYDPDQA